MFSLFKYFLTLLVIAYRTCSLQDFQATYLGMPDNKLIQLSYFQIIDTFGISLYFGLNKQKQFKRVNLCKPYTWFTKDSFDPSESKTYQCIQNHTLDFSFATVIAQESTDIVAVDRAVSLNNFPFFLINNSDYFTIRYGSFGLAHVFEDEKYSLMHQLYKHKAISKLSFGFQPTSLTSGHFYFGGLPQSVTHNYHSAFCNVKREDVNWSCSLGQVYFDYQLKEANITSVYHNDAYSYFQSAESKIFAPLSFMDHLANTLFKQLIDHKDCVYERSPSFGMFYCKGIRLTFSYLNFVFEGYSYKIDINELFYFLDNRCEFDIISNKWSDNKWIFGTSFLKHFSSEFDYEKQRITFYSPSEFTYTGYNKSQHIIILLISNSVILLIVIGLNSILIIQTRKKNWESASITV